MSNRLNYYYRQKVIEAELDLGFSSLETADRGLAVDHALAGVTTGLAVAQHASPQNLTVDITAGVAYDKIGQRVGVGSPQTLNCAVDEGSVSTSVTTPGNSKIISIFAKFVRALTDPRIDGNSVTVYFNEAESFQLIVRQGAEAASPSPPALDGTHILLADITLTFGQTQIVNANISTTRREDLIVVSGAPHALRNNTIKSALSSLLGFQNSHYTGGADRHAASAIDGSATGNWADASNVGAGTLQVMLNEIVSDLAASGGAAKVGAAATGNWADATSIGAGSVQAQHNEIVSDLAATTGDVKIGSPARAGTRDSLAAGSVGSQLAELIGFLNTFESLVQQVYPLFSGASRRVSIPLNAPFENANSRFSAVTSPYVAWEQASVADAGDLIFHVPMLPTVSGTAGINIVGVEALVESGSTRASLPTTMPMIELLEGLSAAPNTNGSMVSRGTQSDTSPDVTEYAKVHTISLTVSLAFAGDDQYYVRFKGETGGAGAAVNFRLIAIRLLLEHD